MIKSGMYSKPQIISALKQIGELFLLGSALFVTGCMTAEGAAQLGRSEHPKVIASYGGVYENPHVTGYVTQVGRTLAAETKAGPTAFRYTTLDTPIVNAFALPGGFTYVTRGLLALVNDEAELAGVLGHEMTHITEAHTEERYNRAQAAGIGTLLVGIATGSQDLMDIAGYGSQLFLLGYSRDQEYQSDSKGISLMDRAGYDPFAMGDFLAAMGAQSALNARIAGKGYDPNRVDYFSTHPNTADRVARAHRIAQNRGAVRGQKKRGQGDYFDHVDGMLYGDSPDQGFVRGRRFSHPQMKFEFRAPERFVLTNTPIALIGQGPDGAAFQFDGAPDYRPGSMLANYITGVWAPKLKIRVGNLRQTRVNGIAAASATATVQTSRGSLNVKLVALAQSPDKVFRFLIVVPSQANRRLKPSIDAMLASYRRLSDAEAAALKPLWLRVVTVKRGDTVSGLARRMAFDDYREDRFRALNSLKPADQLRAGQKVKIVTE